VLQAPVEQQAFPAALFQKVPLVPAGDVPQQPPHPEDWQERLQGQRPLCSAWAGPAKARSTGQSGMGKPPERGEQSDQPILFWLRMRQTREEPVLKLKGDF